MGEKQKLQDSIFKAIDNLVNKRLKELKFNYVLDGKITEVISSTLYKVDINEKEYQIKSINGNTYIVGDLVYILIINNNFSEKIILCKKP